MSKGPTKWNRFNWNPIVPGVLSLIWIIPLVRSGWDFSGYTWLRWLGLGWMGLWFGLACLNAISGGEFVEALYSDDDDDGEFEVPDTLAGLLEQVEVSSPVVGLLGENLPPGKDLRAALREHDIGEIADEREAMAVLASYRQLCLADDPRSQHLLSLFRKPGSADVFGCFYRYGMPLVHERLRTFAGREHWGVQGEDEDDEARREIFVLLTTLSGYAYPEAFADIIRAGQVEGLHDNFRWGLVYDAGNAADEDFLTLIKQNGKDLPTGFACVAYLDRCNVLALENDLEPHPFSSDAGVARLGEYFTDRDPEHFSYATSAATALAFIGHPGRDRLLELGSQHLSPKVEAEVAWAGAKLGRPEGIAKLVELTGDWRTGGRAIEFLRELELEDRIPEASSDPAHLALCEMAHWLEHPHELGELPDSLEVLDLREIYWPPLERRSHLAIVRWTRGDDSGAGTTGGTTTWCFFGRDESSEEPLDVYARHCNWQLRAAEIEGAPEDYDALDYGRELLCEKNPDEDWSALPV